MKALYPRGIILALAALAAGCATRPGVESGAEVTRFHLGQLVARGEIAVEPVNAADANSLEFSQISGAVERELAELGWTVVRGDARSEQVALVTLLQGSREAMANRSRVSVGVGGGTGGWGRSGVGVGVGGSIPIGSRSNEIVATELRVRLQRRSDGTAIWEGRAQTEARAGDLLADRAAAASMLADALFRDFPGESGRTIKVR